MGNDDMPFDTREYLERLIKSYHLEDDEEMKDVFVKIYEWVKRTDVILPKELTRYLAAHLGNLEKLGYEKSLVLTEALCLGVAYGLKVPTEEVLEEEELADMPEHLVNNDEDGPTMAS